MKIPVEPTIFRVPGKGDVTINQLEVRVSSYALGGGATSFYDLQTLQTVQKTRPVTDANGNTTTETYSETETLSYGLVGNSALTQGQFNNWGTDDYYFATCIATNLGLTPVTSN